MVAGWLENIHGRRVSFPCCRYQQESHSQLTELTVQQPANFGTGMEWNATPTIDELQLSISTVPGPINKH